MAPSKPTKAPKSGPSKKPKLFHPDSRKAAQMNRKAVRKEKLDSLATKRKTKHQDLANFHSIFHAHIEDVSDPLTLPQLHEIIRDQWLRRNDQLLQAEQSERRKGRPKSAKEMNLEQIHIQDTEQYRTGIDVIDLRDPTTFSLFKNWDTKDVPYLETLTMVRLNSTDLSSAIICRRGTHGAYGSQGSKPDGGLAPKTVDSMDESYAPSSTPTPAAGCSAKDSVPALMPHFDEPAERFSSSMMCMDDI